MKSNFKLLSLRGGGSYSKLRLVLIKKLGNIQGFRSFKGKIFEGSRTKFTNITDFLEFIGQKHSDRREIDFFYSKFKVSKPFGEIEIESNKLETAGLSFQSEEKYVSTLNLLAKALFREEKTVRLHFSRRVNFIFADNSLRDGVNKVDFEKYLSALKIGLDEEQVGELTATFSETAEFISLDRMVREMSKFGVKEQVSVEESCFFVRIADHLVKTHQTLLAFLNKLNQGEDNIRLTEQTLRKLEILDNALPSIPSSLTLNHSFSSFLLADKLSKFTKMNGISLDFTPETLSNSKIGKHKTLSNQSKNTEISEKPVVRREFTLINYKTPVEEDVSESEDD